jgi:hypothetical protein
MATNIDAIRAIHNGIQVIPTDGTVGLHGPLPYFHSDKIEIEREMLINHAIVDVRRNGKQYLYTTDVGRKLSSFYKPHTIQWTPTP